MEWNNEIIAIYSNIAVFVQVFVGSVGYSIYCYIPTNIPLRAVWLVGLTTNSKVDYPNKLIDLPLYCIR